MAKPPNIQIPGLRRGAGIPPGHIVGRLPSAGKGPAQLLTQSALGRFGLTTKAVVQGMIAAALANPSVGMGRPGMDGQDGEDGQQGSPGLKGDTGATGAAGTPAVGQRLVVQTRSSSFGVNGGPSAVTLATAPTKGNLLVAIVAQAQVNGVPAAGTGWTLDNSFTASVADYYVVYYKYAGVGELASQQPQVQTLDYAGMTVWEISGVSGTWAIDRVNVAFNDNNAPVSTSFTDAGYSTTAGGSLVLAMIVGDNALGYATPTIMVQVGSGTLTADDHVGATGGLDGASIVAGHYTLVTTIGTALKESTSSANSSHWGSIYVEMASIGAAGPTGATGATGAAGSAGRDGMMGLAGADGEDGLTIPGQRGATGAQGQIGPPGFEGADGEDGLTIPGPAGATGATGATGSTGAAGSAGSQGMIGPPGVDGEGTENQDWSLPAGVGIALPLTGGIVNGMLTVQATGGVANTFTVQGEGTTSFTFQRSSTDTPGPNMSGSKSRGTIGSPTVVSTNDKAFTFIGFGYGGTGYKACGQLQFNIIDPTPSDTSMQGQVTMSATKAGSTGAGLFFQADWTNGLKLFTFAAFNTTGAVVAVQAPPYSKQVPATGFSITVANTVNSLILNPAGTLATGTITMPATPQDGHTVEIATTQIITALTVQANTGQTLSGTVTTLGVSGFAKWQYVLADTNWYRVG